MPDQPQPQSSNFRKHYRHWPVTNFPECGMSNCTPGFPTPFARTYQRSQHHATLRSPCTNTIIIPHPSLVVQVAVILKKFIDVAMKPFARLGLPSVLSFAVVVGGFLLKRKILHSFAPWAQLRQPEKHELRYSRNKKRKQLAKNCALGANPICPWNYPAPVTGWVEMARVALLRVCPSLHPLQTLLSAAFCAPEAVVSGLLSVARDQRLLVPVGALRRMLFANACLGHMQQRPGSDMPQLGAGKLHWLTSTGLSSVEVFEVIAQAVRTQVQRGLGGALPQQWHLWRVDPPPSVCEMDWRVVVLAAIWAMEQGRKRLRSLV
jgi:hypothetical protein